MASLHVYQKLGVSLPPFDSKYSWYNCRDEELVNIVTDYGGFIHFLDIYRLEIFGST